MREKCEDKNNFHNYNEKQELIDFNVDKSIEQLDNSENISFYLKPIFLLCKRCYRKKRLYFILSKSKFQENKKGAG